MILTIDDLQMDLNSIGVQTLNGWRWQSNRYECPRHQWAETTFAQAFYENRRDAKEDHYQIDKWMCGHISGIAQADAREMWCRTPTPAGHPLAGIAWGCFDYVRIGVPVGPHSITFIDEDHTLYFYEPQIWLAQGSVGSARLNLTDEELGSCFGGQA